MNSTGEIADTTPREKKHKKKNRKRAEPDPDEPATRDFGKLYFKYRNLQKARLLRIRLWISLS